MIDTHAHVNPSKSLPSEDLRTFDKGDLKDFKIEGLEYVVLSASNIETSKSNIKLAKINPKLLAAVGIHPQEIISNFKFQISNLEKLLKENPKIVAVGECGLEFIEPYNKELQIENFRAQITLAKRYHKPLIVHARKAVEEVFDILRGSETRG